MKLNQNDPYVAFEDDEQRCKALESRDRRYVKVALMVVVAVIVGILHGASLGGLSWLRWLPA